MAMEPEATASSNADATTLQTASSGSGATIEQRQAEVDAQNSRELEAGIKASLKRKNGDTDGDAERATRGSATTAVTALPSPRGQKRNAKEDADDAERMDRSLKDEPKIPKGQKRKDIAQDDVARTEDRADDMSSLTQHPGPIQYGERIDKADLSWKHIRSGVFARTFPRSRRLVTTSRGGPQIQDVHRRIVRNLTTGKVIDDCVIEDTPDRILHRRMKDADNIRIDLIMEGALKMYEESGADVAKVYLQRKDNARSGYEDIWRNSAEARMES